MSGYRSFVAETLRLVIVIVAILLGKTVLLSLPTVDALGRLPAWESRRNGSAGRATE